MNSLVVTESSPKDNDDHVRAHITAVTGPVYLLYAQAQNGVLNRHASLREDSLVTLVSIAGIDLSIGGGDRERFVYNSPQGILMLNQPEYENTMYNLWFMVLEAMRRSGVRHVVLNAIGCGVLGGSIPVVPSLVAKSLYAVMRERYDTVRTRITSWGDAASATEPPRTYSSTDPAFDSVIVCFPARDTANIQAFREAFADPVDHLRVALFPYHSMVNVAGALAKQYLSVGMLNPSTVAGVRGGWIGGYFARAGNPVPDRWRWWW
jgi:hypothetical protein